MIKRLPTYWVLIVGCLCGPTWSQAGESLGAMEDIRDQAVLYLRRNMPKLAKVRLDRVYRSKGGASDFITVFYRGRAALLLYDLDTAHAMLREAADLASAKREKKLIQRTKAEFNSDFGSIRVLPALNDTRTSGGLDLELISNLISKRKRGCYLSAQQRLRAVSTTLPTTLYLPYGQYRINGVDFEIQVGKKTEPVRVYLKVFDQPSSLGTATWWWIGSGVVAATVVGVAAVMLMEDPETKYRDVLRIQLD